MSRAFVKEDAGGDSGPEYRLPEPDSPYYPEAAAWALDPPSVAPLVEFGRTQSDLVHRYVDRDSGLDALLDAVTANMTAS